MYNTILLGKYHPIVSLIRQALEHTDFLRYVEIIAKFLE